MPDFEKFREKAVAFFVSRRAFYLLLLAAMLLKSFPFGFRYFLFADDFNQYGAYALRHGDIWNNVLIHFGLYGYRPLAGLLDVYIISRLWDHLEFVLLGMTLLHFASVILLDRIFEKSNIVWGRAASVFFALYPTLTESAYWISASSRIVTSAFFSIMAAFSILKFIRKEGNYCIWFAVAMVCGLLAQGFYEQGIIFAFTLLTGLLVIHRKEVKNKVLFIWPFMNIAIIGAYYYIFRDVGLLSKRVEPAAQGFFKNIPVVAERIARTFVLEQWPTISNTLRWGIGRLFTEHPVLTASVAVLSLLLALHIGVEKAEGGDGISKPISGAGGATPEGGDGAAKPKSSVGISKPKGGAIRDKTGVGTSAAKPKSSAGGPKPKSSAGGDKPDKNKKTAYSLLAGIVLTVCTLSVFFVLPGTWVWVRNFFFSVTGLGILVGTAARCIKWDRNRIIGIGVKTTKTIAAAVITFVFFCGFILEVNSLRLVEKYDDIIVRNLIAEVEHMELEDTTETVWFFGPGWNYSEVINHRITSQVRIDWAVNGHYTVLSGGNRKQWISPVMAGATADPDFEKDALVGLDSELDVRELFYSANSLFFADTGEVFGSLEPGENGAMVFRRSH